MDIPPIHHRVWGDLVTGKINTSFECLALRVLLGRIHAAGDPSPAATAKNTVALREMCVKNAHLPSLQRDLAKALR